MPDDSIIVKIGGKILEHPENLDATLIQFKEIVFERKLLHNIIIISGGGSYANFIRKIDAKLNIGDDLAHWMAILAMEYNGIKLSEKYSEIQYINNFEVLYELLKSGKKRHIIVFGPYNLLHSKDPLSHSWELTSDSITLYIAHQLGFNECFLIKDIDGIYIKGQKQVIKEISTTQYNYFKKSGKLADFGNYYEIKRSKPIDSYLLELIDKYKIPCIILNGENKNFRIRNYFEEKKNNKKIYTKIYFV